ncbi:MAG: hypothetical protein NTW59_03520 [Candidatus Diapherotrites archaeon]|nr:hypothetical protein [Candidatus Diapherotrites archaeon]
MRARKPIRRAAKKKPILSEAMKARRTPIGSHGTRAWNADEMRRFGSAEVYFYAITGKQALRGLGGKEMSKRFLNSIGGNISYWANKHVPSMTDLVRNPQETEMPAIVFVKHSKGALLDENFFSAGEPGQPFKPYSATIEPKQIVGTIRLSVPEFQRIAANLQAKGNLSRDNMIREISLAMKRKAVAFFREK